MSPDLVTIGTGTAEPNSLTFSSVPTAPLTNRTPLRPARDQLIQVHVVPEGQVVELKASGLAFDLDDTTIKHSAEYLHDGPTGRFALAVSRLIKNEIDADLELNHNLSDFLLPVDMTRKSLFSTETWQPFRDLTGRAEDEVINSMIDLLKTKFDIHRSLDAFKRVLSQVLEDDFVAMCEEGEGQVCLDEGVKNLLIHAEIHDLRRCICSASGPEFVTTALQNWGLLDGKKLYIEKVIAGAEKKEPNGTYTGKGFTRASDEMGVATHETIAFGDTTSDLFGAILAGYPAVVIRLPNPETMEADRKKMLLQIETFVQSVNIPHIPTGQPPQVFFVEKFYHVRINNSGDSGFSYSVRPKGKKSL